TTLALETARDLVVDVVRSLARHGPRRFYALNTGVSTDRALAPAAARLAAEGVTLRFGEVLALLAPVEREVCEQAGGTHADEVETSLMLHIAPARVDMSKAVRDLDATGKGPLTRVRGGAGTYSPSGIYGDPTLATEAKGRRIAEAWLEGVLREIEALRA